MMKTWIRRSLLAAATALAMGPAWAAFPDHPVTLVAPYPAGGAADVLARLLAKRLEEPLGKTVIVENKPGAGTAIGAAYVANAKPDGYTLLLSSNSTFTMNPAAGAKTSYDPARSFEALGLVANLPLAVLVNASVPANTVKELVAAAKANPEKYPYGSFGNATSSHYAGAMFAQATGLNLLHVPYKGSAPLMTDLIGGQIPLSFDTVVAAGPQVKSGKVKILAVTSPRRAGAFPNVPTMAESGYPGFDLTAWIALVAPHALPPEVKDRLFKALASVAENPETQEAMRKAGFEPQWTPITDWPGMVTKDTARMKAVADKAQIRLD